MKLVRYLIIAFVVIVFAVMLTDMARADEATVRRVAQEESIDPDLAAAVARCESGFRHEARNGRYRGVFQMGPGWESHGGTIEDQTREFARAVKAGSASRHWTCWPGGRRARSQRLAHRAASPPTGTDRCDRVSGQWRCHPSWTKPDALAVSPTIELDPGPHVDRCYWRGDSWTCDLAQPPAPSVTPTAEPTPEPEEPENQVRLGNWLLALLGVVLILGSIHREFSSRT